MEALSNHQHRIIEAAAAKLAFEYRGEFFDALATRLGKCQRYSDFEVTRACKLSLRRVLEAA